MDSKPCLYLLKGQMSLLHTFSSFVILSISKYIPIKKDVDDSFYYQRHSILINFSLNVLIKISGITLTSAFPENTDFLTKDVTVFYKPKTE